ncbi:MAG: hypothetical protein AAFP20_19225 [Cyanobacteria bacterium J06614_10]
MAQFIQIGDIVINPAAIATVHDTGDEVIITLLSSAAADINGSVVKSETLEFCGKEGKAIRAYFFSSMVSRKIV